MSTKNTKPISPNSEKKWSCVPTTIPTTQTSKSNNIILELLSKSYKKNKKNHSKGKSLTLLNPIASSVSKSKCGKENVQWSKISTKIFETSPPKTKILADNQSSNQKSKTLRRKSSLKINSISKKSITCFSK